MCLDRAVHDAVSRHLKENAAFVQSQLAKDLAPGKARLLDLLTWHTSSGCALHDTHGGFRRGFSDYAGDPQNLKDAWHVIQSFRDSMNDIAQGIAEWLPTVLSFRVWDMCEDSQRILWEALGLEPEVISVQLQLQLRWQDDRLCIHPSARDDPEAPQAIATTLLSIWRIKEWTESRWGTMGSSCRSAVLAMVTGLPSLIACLRRKPGASEYYLSGWSKLSESVRTMFLLGALGSWVTDGIMAVLFDDDRLPMVINNIDDDVACELAWLAGFPEDVWVFLAGKVGVPVQGIRSDAFGVAMASASYCM
jgi:hypothetical protein